MKIYQRFDAWRPVPRLLMAVYMWLCITTAQWFMDLPDPTASQAAFASAIISAGSVWFGLYLNGKREEVTEHK